MHNVQPYFYACYLLLSLGPLAKNIVYVGSTPNPIRRLRQHNGEIKGGAKKTATKRPWEMVVVVYGFSNKNSALQFEWAWQNPHKSRHLKDGDYRSKEKHLTAKIKVLESMLQASPYNRWPLNVYITNHNVSLVFRHELIPRHIKVATGPLNALLELHKEDSFADINDASSLQCPTCLEQVNVEDLDDWLCCTDERCPMVSHLLCLSVAFLHNDRKKLEMPSLLPISGQCTWCNKELKWGTLVFHMKTRIAQQQRYNQLQVEHMTSELESKLCNV